MKRVCPSCGGTICRVPGCEASERALRKLLDRLPPPRKPTEQEVAEARARTRVKV